MLKFEPTHTSISNKERKIIEFIEDEEINGDIPLEWEVFLDEFIDSNLYSNYHATSLGTYCIFYEGRVIPKLVKDPSTPKDFSFVLWTLHFDGVGCKVGSGTKICLLKSFCLQFSCSNNEAEYEGLIQGLSLVERLGIK